MGWGDLLAAFNDVPQLAARNDDDAYDRLSHRWTAGILILFAVLVSTNQYVGDPIHCWCPAHFADSWKKYADNYCWVRNTYYLPFHRDIPRDPDFRRKWPVMYYQWVPLILMVQAIMFYLPIAVWRNLNHRTGMDVNNIIETSEKLKVADMEVRKKLLTFLTKQTHRYIKGMRTPPKHGNLCLEGCRVNVKWIVSHICCCVVGKKFGNYMAVVYLLVKLMFIGNVIAQLFILDRFLGHGYHFYGIDVLSAVVQGDDWTNTPRFPRVTLCDLRARIIGNVQQYTLQCVLTVNLFNEKIYLFLWFWLVFVGILSILGFIAWILRLFIPGDQRRYISNLLVQGDRIDLENDLDIKRLHVFVNDYLRRDGVLVIRLMDLNTDKMTVEDFVGSLWHNFVTLRSVARLNQKEDDVILQDGEV